MGTEPREPRPDQIRIRIPGMEPRILIRIPGMDPRVLIRIPGMDPQILIRISGIAPRILIRIPGMDPSWSSPAQPTLYERQELELRERAERPGG